MQNKYHVKKGDKVYVNSGKWQGKQGEIVAVLSKKDRVVVELEGLNDKQRRDIGMRTVKPNAQNPNGGLVARSVSVHVSNVNKLRDASAE
jgi:large subunit ribosomal protein L24